MVTAPAVRKIDVTLPPLHKGRDGSGGQLEVFSSPARFKVVCCGRRWGKTTLGVCLCFKDALKGKRVWWVAPTYKVAFIGWRMARHLCQQLNAGGLDIDIREGDRCLIFPNGGEIWIKSADDPDSLRGEGLDGVVLDECAYIKQAAWSEALRPALADKKGWALFIGTPAGKNWFYNLFQLAQHRPGWQAWRKPTVDNPYIDPDEIEAARQESPSDELYRQEYEADFGASQLQVYNKFDLVTHRWKWEIPKFDMFVGGLDFGGTTIGSHKSAGALGGIVAGTDILVELYEFEEAGPNVGTRQLDWMAASEIECHKLNRRAGIQSAVSLRWAADKSQFRYIDQMRNAGYAISPSKGGQDSVQAGIQLVQTRLNVQGDGKTRFYYSPDLKYIPSAMERYRYPELKDEEQPQSKNPLKVNDDMVDAIRYQIEQLDTYVMGDPQELYGNLLPAVR